MSLTDKIKNYFVGTNISRDYNYTREDLAKKIKDQNELRQRQRNVTFLKFIDVGVCKYLPTFFSATTLSYGVYTKNPQLVFWGLFFGEGSRLLYGHFHKDLRKSAGILKAPPDYGKESIPEKKWYE